MRLSCSEKIFGPMAYEVGQQVVGVNIEYGDTQLLLGITHDCCDRMLSMRLVGFVARFVMV
jgi:hypothetical protein